MSSQPFSTEHFDQNHRQEETVVQPTPVVTQPDYQQAPYQAPSAGWTYQPSNDVMRTSNMAGMRAESRYETYRDPMGNVIESRQQVVRDQNQMRANIRYWVRTITYFVLSVLEVILLLRFVFRLLGANPTNSFVAFLYDVSYPFMVGFHGIFADQALGKVGVFEVSTLIAMLIYALLAWGIVSLAEIIFSPVLSSRRSVTTTSRSQY